MEKNKTTQIKKEYLVIGDNNFWYASCGTLKEAKQVKNDILKGNKDHDYNGDGQCTMRPDTVYIYVAIEI